MRIFVYRLSFIAICALIAWGLHHWGGLNFWAGIGLVAFALFLNGVLAEIEDRMPGGFLNPKKKDDKKD